jgi:hypothetical protein
MKKQQSAARPGDLDLGNPGVRARTNMLISLITAQITDQSTGFALHTSYMCGAPIRYLLQTGSTWIF